MPGAAAFRGIAGDVEKITFLVAAGTGVGGLGRGESKAAFAAAPEGKIALGADIPHELARRRIAAKGAFHGHSFFRGCHFFYLAFLG